LGKLSDPFDVAVGPSGDVLVSDLNDNRVVEFDASGNYLLQIASQGDWPGQKRPVGVAFDATGNIFVTDNDGRIQEFDSAGNFVTSFGGLPINEGAFEELDHVTFDTAGQALVADGYHQVVDVFSVPEPAAISVLSIGGLAMLRYRRTD
jgi:DNA-binding beta-propeller fold protein YncE